MLSIHSWHSSNPEHSWLFHSWIFRVMNNSADRTDRPTLLITVISINSNLNCNSTMTEKRFVVDIWLPRVYRECYGKGYWGGVWRGAGGCEGMRESRWEWWSSCWCDDADFVCSAVRREWRASRLSRRSEVNQLVPWRCACCCQVRMTPKPVIRLSVFEPSV